jgi:exosortase/archaeosortase family protein
MNKMKNSSSQSWFDEKKPILKLLVLFSLGIIAFLIITNLPFFTDVIYPKIILVNAAASSLILKILGYGTTWSGDQITSEAASISIRKGCDALAPIAIFGSVLLAYPAAIKPKIKAVILGVFTLFGINIIRIISLFMFQIHAPDLFDLMHLVVWQGIFIFLALMLCFYWIKSFESKTEYHAETE